MRTVWLATLSFAVGRVMPTLLLMLMLSLQGSRRTRTLDDLLMASYLVAVSASLATVGFLIPTALSATWRQFPARRGAVIAGVLGLVSPIAALLLTAVIARAVLPLFHAAPWLAIGILQGGPGVVLGLVAVVIAYARAKR